MQTLLPMTCDECQGEARFVTSVASFGAAPGARFYQCNTCGRLQVEEFTSAAARDTSQTNYSDAS
jgi:hypothetical protein